MTGRPGTRGIAYVVAPYGPIGRSEFVNLGAAAKIESVVRILRLLGYRVRLVNSAHNERRFRATRIRRTLMGGGRILEIEPFTVPWRPIGKLLNLIPAFLIGRRLAAGNPHALVWAYNGYAFESLLAIQSRPCPLVLEIEDLPFTRNRGLRSMKDWMDSTLLHRAIPHARLVTVVNARLAGQLPATATEPLLLPSLLRESIAGISARKPFDARPYRIGYFGGLNAEKGAHVMLALARDVPEGWEVVITGTGPLAPDFRAAAAHSNRVTFHEAAPEETLCALIGSCDLLVNPHRPIEQMGDGIFPFKVVEYLSTGRLVVSTPLPECGLDLAGTLLEFDGTEPGLRRMLLDAARLHAERTGTIAATSMKVRESYSEPSVARRIGVALGLERLPHTDPRHVMP